MVALLLVLTMADALPIVSIILGGGFVTALIAIYKARPERDSVVVTSAQNAATILRGLNEALYTDLTRARQERDEAERRVDAYEAALRANGITIPPVAPLPKPPEST